MILVTGGTGLVGAHLLVALVNNGEKVRAIQKRLISLGYNLGKTLTIKVKNEYSDDPDQYVKELKYYYDDDGKHVTTMTVEKTDSERDAEYVSSEKRLNEDGEFEEIEYTDEEHYKNLKRFVQSYSKRGDEHKIWDKLQEKTLKVQSKNSRFSDFQNKRLELQKEIEVLRNKVDDK